MIMQVIQTPLYSERSLAHLGCSPKNLHTDAQLQTIVTHTDKVQDTYEYCS